MLSETELMLNAFGIPKPFEPFKDLPDELHVKIFSYLDSKDIEENVSKVCQKFEQISKDPYFKRKEILDNFTKISPSPRICKLFRIFLAKMKEDDLGPINYITNHYQIEFELFGEHIISMYLLCVNVPKVLKISGHCKMNLVQNSDTRKWLK